MRDKKVTDHLIRKVLRQVQYNKRVLHDKTKYKRKVKHKKKGLDNG